MDTFTIDIDGIDIYYVAKGEGKPILYVHGNVGSSAWWERTMIVPGYRTIALDLPNFGRSGRIADTSPENQCGTKSGKNLIDFYAEYLARFIETLKLGAPTVVGHSLGGAVAMSLVSRRPELVSGLVLVDSASPDGLLTPEEKMPFVDMLRQSKTIMTQALAGVAPTLKDQTFLAHLVDDAMMMDPDAFRGNARALGSFSARAGLGAFKGRVLVLLGAKDALITPAVAEDTAMAFSKGEVKIIEGLGHSVMVEDPSALLRMLKEFLE